MSRDKNLLISFYIHRKLKICGCGLQKSYEETNCVKIGINKMVIYISVLLSEGFFYLIL